ncbi:hypothetical protein LAZ67_8000382 [Cordylochernes scorpioides]|uniref:RNase H type-1 domain-containing protein n=1 Tax=Cordylochernes scorpioides TaxID=51811 RepID=A0ABY6KRC2_9ARAC|nr:hypothetical protein LAZ67_8000382 [Cordylochernes scorpioides]
MKENQKPFLILLQGTKLGFTILIQRQNGNLLFGALQNHLLLLRKFTELEVLENKCLIERQLIVTDIQQNAFQQYLKKSSKADQELNLEESFFTMTMQDLSPNIRRFSQLWCPISHLSTIFTRPRIKFDTDDEALQAFINAVNSIPEDDWCKCFHNWFSWMKSGIGAKISMSTAEASLPFLVDVLDAAGADARMVQGLVREGLGPAHPADVCTHHHSAAATRGHLVTFSPQINYLIAHVGIPGNELADSLAKAGALGLPEARESTTQLDERDLLRTIKTQCLQEWKSNAAHDWYRAGGTSIGSTLPREQQSLISRLKSGHLRTMTFQNGCKAPENLQTGRIPADTKRSVGAILPHAATLTSAEVDPNWLDPRSTPELFEDEFEEFNLLILAGKQKDISVGQDISGVQQLLQGRRDQWQG